MCNYTPVSTQYRVSKLYSNYIYLQNFVGESTNGYDISQYNCYNNLLNLTCHKLEWEMVDGVFQNVVKFDNKTLTVNPKLVEEYLDLQITLNDLNEMGKRMLRPS